MAQNIYAVLHGNQIGISDLTGPFQSCRSCGGKIASINIFTPGNHAGELICDGCGAHTAFLSRDHMAALLAQRRAA